MGRNLPPIWSVKVFRDAFVNTCDVNLELYNTDGAQGAARGAGIGIGLFTQHGAFKNLKVIERQEPDSKSQGKYTEIYKTWNANLEEKFNLYS